MELSDAALQGRGARHTGACGGMLRGDPLINSDKELQSSGTKIDMTLAELGKLGYAKGA